MSDFTDAYLIKDAEIKKLQAELDKAKSEVRLGNTIIEQLQRSTKILVQTLEAHAAKQSEALKVLKDMGAWYSKNENYHMGKPGIKIETEVGGYFSYDLGSIARESLKKVDEILGVKK